MVDKKEVALINQYGGKLNNDAAGVTIDEMQQAIKLGVCKINIATDFRLLWTRVHREFFVQSPELFDPVIPGKKYMDAFVELMGNRFDVLGSAGKAEELSKNLNN